MTAQIISLRAWRLAHPAPRRFVDAHVRLALLPLRLWLAWWGIKP